MRTTSLLCALVVLVLGASATAAPGVNLRWGSCLADGGLTNRNFACNTNNGSNVLDVSFELAQNLSQVSGTELVIDLGTASATLPLWWQFRNAGFCRQTSLTEGPLVGVLCPDWSGGNGTSAIAAYQLGIFGANTARILSVSAVAQEQVVNLVAGQEYNAHRITIDNAKSVGTGSCAGCSTAACLAVNSINITTAGNTNNTKLSAGTNGGINYFATWQGGAGVVVGGKIGCPQAVPVQNSTWGAVKALYR